MTNLDSYADTLRSLMSSVEVSDASGRNLAVDEAIDTILSLLHQTRDAGKKNMFLGNGGSAAIASHMAIDYSKNGRLPSMCLNDGAALTCLGNDLGYDRVFSEQLKIHAKPEDLIFAVSSSGASANMLRAAQEAVDKECRLVTLSGFSADNPLRKLGHLNWYVSSNEYGFVEICHLIICHAILDIHMGLAPG